MHFLFCLTRFQGGYGCQRIEHSTQSSRIVHSSNLTHQQNMDHQPCGQTCLYASSAPRSGSKGCRLIIPTCLSSSPTNAKDELRSTLLIYQGIELYFWLTWRHKNPTSRKLDSFEHCRISWCRNFSGAFSEHPDPDDSASSCSVFDPIKLIC